MSRPVRRRRRRAADRSGSMPHPPASIRRSTNAPTCRPASCAPGPPWWSRSIRPCWSRPAAPPRSTNTSTSSSAWGLDPMTDPAPLDPVTFEVLKNAFISSVDQVAEQILRTCYSFLIYNRDFSNALNDVNGDSIAQGNADIAVHVGTLHYTCKETIRYFEGDMKPGDVYAINDPYAGGTHFPDVRLIRPIFAGGDIIAFSQSNGHWSDVGGSVPVSFDVLAREMFREGLRITPDRLFDNRGLGTE